MTAGLLLITHGNLGQEMLNTVTGILHQCPLQARALAVSSDCDPDTMYAQAASICDQLDQGDGVVVLTDLFGSTPSNIAHRLTDSHRVAVISGANIPMLLRILNYPDMDLRQLCDKAASGACDGVVVTPGKQDA
jgi:PTS system ascorbate-specific IIA component